MADDMEAMLRNSLNAVDRGRRWAMLGGVALLVATVLAVGVVIKTAYENCASCPTRDVSFFKVLFAGVIAQILLIASCTGIVMAHISRVARAILRSIELSERKRA